jgi:hypothetical protein
MFWTLNCLVRAAAEGFFGALMGRLLLLFCPFEELLSALVLHDDAGNRFEKENR